MKVEISRITIPEDRQRKEFSEREMNALKSSMALRGQITPITVTKDFALIAGERRLRCAIALGWKEITVNIFDELTVEEQEVVQLDENLRRANLTWQEEAKAHYKIHSLLKAKDTDWTQKKTAEYMGISISVLTTNLRLATYLLRDPEKIAHCNNASAAENVIIRLEQRLVEKAESKVNVSVAETLENIFSEKDIPLTTVREVVEQTKPALLAEERILHADFAAWANSYSGPKFNFVHCDFPYGVNLQKSAQMKSDDWDAYEDTPEVFWNLCEALFSNKDKLLSPSAHIMFWFSMGFYEELMEYIGNQEGFVVNPFPLIWLKTDGSGILPDPNRGPRRIYETALIITRGDRHVVKPVANGYPAPLGTKSHLSEKPQPVLRHFLRMFLDESSTVLDPTCGSGNALAVAEEFKVKYLLGMDVDEKSVELARSNLRRAKAYSKLEEVEL